MAVELDHSFTTSKPIDESFAAITDLERVVPAVQGGSVLEATSPDSVKAEILVKMGAMSMRFTGTVEVTERDEAEHRAVLTVKSREAGGQGHANATATITLQDGGGTLHTRGRRRRRARRAHHGLHDPARRHLTPWPGS